MVTEEDKKLYEKMKDLWDYIEYTYFQKEFGKCTIIHELSDKLNQACNWFLDGKPTEEEIKRRELIEYLKEELMKTESKIRERELLEETMRRRMEEIENNATGSKNAEED